MGNLPTQFPTRHAVYVAGCFERGRADTPEDWEAIWFVKGWLLRAAPSWPLCKVDGPELTFQEAAVLLQERLQGDKEFKPVLIDLQRLVIALLRLEARSLALDGHETTLPFHPDFPPVPKK